ncbi:MAG: dihydroorotate dehydrogenase electron transfer subunit [Chlorobiaceae bacterium]|nr:dihydroorotate dehydrogenase electron transfer subunit [Chlorobiaceae bacterium]
MSITNTITDVRASIVGSRKISCDVSIITLDCPEIAVCARPGNFVNVKVSDTTQPLLRRPFSIHDSDGRHLYIMVKSVGCGTAIFCNASEGSEVSVLGPLGNCFDTQASGFRKAILVSGGIGTAPMLFLEKSLASRGIEVVNLVGGRTREDLLAENLSDCRFATDDGSAGFRGTVVDLLASELPGLLEDGPVKVFACGPTPMLKALARFCRENGVPAELSLESVMGCGIGICYGCSVEVLNPDGSTGTILLCKDGPVIDADLLAL